jgi:hypothetical protein
MGGERKPAFQFYPDDWRADLNLQLCSLAARGLWIEMMVAMHYGTPYGFLRVGDEPVTPEALALVVGADLKQVKACLDELGRREVYSLDTDGAIYSRRMVSDHEKAEAHRATKSTAGKKGAAKRWGEDR